MDEFDHDFIFIYFFLLSFYLILFCDKNIKWNLLSSYMQLNSFCVPIPIPFVGFQFSLFIFPLTSLVNVTTIESSFAIRDCDEFLYHRAYIEIFFLCSASDLLSD